MRFFQSIQLVLFIILIFILSSCESHEEQSQAITPADKWEVGHGELQSYIGDPHYSGESIDVPFDYLHLHKEIIHQTEYDMSTGKWFLVDGQGKFGYGLTAGTQQAGSPYTATLFSHSDHGDTLDRDIRIQLTKRDPNLNFIQLINEKVIYIENVKEHMEFFTDHLPSEEQAIYLLSMEILDEEGDVEDTLVTTIYVPPKEMNVTLSMDQDVYIQTDAQATLTLKNLGPTFLSLGTYYTIEQEIDGVWRIVPLDLIFQDIGIMLGVQQTYDQSIDLSELSPGTYRIVKEFYADGIEATGTLAIPFTIE